MKSLPVRIFYFILYVASVLNFIRKIDVVGVATEVDITGYINLKLAIFLYSVIGVLIFGGVLIYKYLFRKSKFKFMNNDFIRMAYMLLYGFNFFCYSSLEHPLYPIIKGGTEIQYVTTLIIFIIGGVLIYKHLFSNRGIERGLNEKK